MISSRRVNISPDNGIIQLLIDYIMKSKILYAVNLAHLIILICKQIPTKETLEKVTFTQTFGLNYENNNMRVEADLSEGKINNLQK
ncbi:MAG: hypothetical protein IPN67_13090 [Bacteroidales bacterium]|nr:hypothetical protein [Bacteroidales bacterium]